MVVYSSSKKGELATLNFHNKREEFSIKTNKFQGDWLAEILGLISTKNKKIYTFQEIQNHYENAGLQDFELFWFNKPVNGLGEYGLLVL